MSNEVHRKKDTLFPGNSMTVAELEPLTIQSGGSSSNHYAEWLNGQWFELLFPGESVCFSVDFLTHCIMIFEIIIEM